MKKESTHFMILVAIFAALTAIGAFIKIPLPIVPFTLQIVMVFLAAALLGAKGAFFSQIIYIGLGLIGLPVFNEGGGPMYIFKPSFGFLIGFLIAAFIMGSYLEKKEQKTMKEYITANFIGLIIIYSVALPYLYVMLNVWLQADVSWRYVLMIGFVTSIPADILLAIVSGFLATKLVKALKPIYLPSKV